jgi:hypothetical protein
MFWNPPPVPAKKVVIIAAGKLMSDMEILQALAIGPETLWWRAVIQVIEDFRIDAGSAATGHGATNNALAMAGAVGAYEVLTNLLERLNELRERAVSD